MDNKKVVKKVVKNFYCKTCDYNTSRKDLYDKHLFTGKHARITMDNKKVVKGGKISFSCGCGKNYQFHSGLCKHQKKCMIKNEKNEHNEHNHVNTSLIESNQSVIDLFKMQIQENKEMQQIIIDQNKKIIELSREKGTYIHNNTNNTIHNKFNLNFFLNEQCKDALNISDFIHSLQLQLTDLEKVGKLGYVEGLSQIIVNGLKKLDIYKRPVHCSDFKRETLYVKDENQWTKEDADKKKMKNVIQQITHKNIKVIPEWTKANPSCTDGTSNKNDEYMKLLSNCMSGDCQEEQTNNVNKIITKVAKEIIIEK
jgi:hypothetical protein